MRDAKAAQGINFELGSIEKAEEQGRRRRCRRRSGAREEQRKRRNRNHEGTLTRGEVVDEARSEQVHGVGATTSAT